MTPRASCLVAALLLAACAREPFLVAPSAAVVEEARAAVDPEERDSATVISICYSSAIDSEASILEVAARACPAGRLELLAQDSFWNGCALFQPVRASFICLAGPAPAVSATRP